MAYTRVIGMAVIGALAAAPLFARAAEGQRRRGGSEGGQQRAEGSPGGSRGRVANVPLRECASRRARIRPAGLRSHSSGRHTRRATAASGNMPCRGRMAIRDTSRSGRSRHNASHGGQRYEAPRYDTGRYTTPRQYDVRRYEPRAVQRPYYSRGGYAPRTVIVPRYIRPSIVTVVPYRPYVYRPRFGIGVYYGAGGSYPYGYTPRGLL